METCRPVLLWGFSALPSTVRDGRGQDIRGKGNERPKRISVAKKDNEKQKEKEEKHEGGFDGAAPSDTRHKPTAGMVDAYGTLGGYILASQCRYYPSLAAR